MHYYSTILNEDGFQRAVTRISHEILERNKGAENLVLLGIRRRGTPIARMIQENILRIEGAAVPCDEIDIRYYRDDLSTRYDQPELRKAVPGIDVQEKTVVLVDDVIYTGRTARAAIEAVFTMGRPRAIQLAILVDRGHRELPIRPDYVGKNVPTAKSEVIGVCVPEYDGRRCVELWKQEESC